MIQKMIIGRKRNNIQRIGKMNQDIGKMMMKVHMMTMMRVMMKVVMMGVIMNIEEDFRWVGDIEEYFKGQKIKNKIRKHFQLNHFQLNQPTNYK